MLEGALDEDDDALEQAADGETSDVGAGADADTDDADAPGDEDGALDVAAQGAGAAAPSAHERRLARMAARIARMEEANMGEREWFLRGEAGAGARPLNSALEVDLDFARAARPPPAPTEAATASLEDLIRRRCAERAWDDPPRAAPPAPAPRRRELELDDRRSAKARAPAARPAAWGNPPPARRPGASRLRQPGPRRCGSAGQRQVRRATRGAARRLRPAVRMALQHRGHGVAAGTAAPEMLCAGGKGPGRDAPALWRAPCGARCT